MAKRVWGIASGLLDRKGPVRLLKVNINTGEISAERSFETSVWSIPPQTIPARFVPRIRVPVSVTGTHLQPGQNP